MKKWMYGLIFIVLAIGLVGCNKSEANVDLSSYPEIVQNGEVSVEFYDDLLNYLNVDDQKREELSQRLSQIGTIDTEEIYKNISTYNDYLEGLVPDPETEVDIEINELMMANIEHQKTVNDFIELFLNSEDHELINEIYTDAINTSIEELDNSREGLLNVMKDNGIEYKE